MIKFTKSVLSKVAEAISIVFKTKSLVMIANTSNGLFNFLKALWISYELMYSSLSL